MTSEKTSSVNVLVVFLIMVLISVAGWYFFLRKTAKESAVDYLIKHRFTKGKKETMMSFGDDYLAAWHKAAKENNVEFELNGKIYLTQGGKAKV